MKAARKKWLAVLFSFFSLFLNACKWDRRPSIIKNNKETGTKLFEKDDKEQGVSVFFFDDDNVVNENGTDYTRPRRQNRHSSQNRHSIGSSDCYMVKSGTTDLLVDGGYQQSFPPIDQHTSNSAYKTELHNVYVADECEKNLLRKIASVISSDGILDYLIVTHADYDHLAALIVQGGIFDAFLNHKSIDPLKGQPVQFNKIRFLIDFDSGLVKKFSDESIDKEKRLVSSEVYQEYVCKRNKLIEAGTGYCPAAAFFNSENLQKQSTSITEEHKKIAMPDKIAEKLSKIEKSGVKSKLILDENFDNGTKTKRDEEYKDEDLLSTSYGHIKKAKTTGGENRYYYFLRFNGGELRILYNWHYDYIYHSSFNAREAGKETTKSAKEKCQDANNICVCFTVVKKSFKFLSLGDLGGKGENGLLKYYRDTDILSTTTLFKASHHGSTDSKENSEELFKIVKPAVIVITGCAISPASVSDDDPLKQARHARPRPNQDLFDHISKAYTKKEATPFILCTNIASLRAAEDKVDWLESVPFYGDIKVVFRGRKVYLSHSYVGDIKTYISKDWNSEYFRQHHHEYAFKTRKKNRMRSFQETEWFNDIGFVYGGN